MHVIVSHTSKFASSSNLFNCFALWFQVVTFSALFVFFKSEQVLRMRGWGSGKHMRTSTQHITAGMAPFFLVRCVFFRFLLGCMTGAFGAGGGGGCHNWNNLFMKPRVYIINFSSRN